MGTLLILDLNDIVGEGDQADGINKIAKIWRPLRPHSPANLGAQQAIEAAGMRVNCKSQVIFMATADDKASIWKKSIPSAMRFQSPCVAHSVQ